MPAIQFDLLREPPTAEQIQAAKDRLHGTIEAERARRRRLLCAWGAFVILAATGTAVYLQSWLVFGLGIGLPFVITLIVAGDSNESEAQLELRSLDRVSAFHLDDILGACDLDPRVEVYRQKVARQPRDMVIAEAEACRYWKWKGYADACNWAAVRSQEPLEFEDSVPGGQTELV